MDERRRDPVVLLFGCVLAVLVAFIWWESSQLSRDLHAERQARDALALQVQQLGEKPVAGPPGSRGEPGEAVTGPRGPTGPPGPAVTGPAGRDGRDAPTPTPVPGPTGPPGASVIGPAGADGAPGVSVTGPAGPPGPAGKDGTDGTNGRDGRDGQTCPEGYSLQPPPGDPDALVCRRSNAPAPTPTPTGTAALGLDPTRRRP